MSNIPVPMIYGANDSEKIKDIISYITRLADTLSRELNSIGIPNLSQELREKIDGAISQHQDLSEYATSAAVEKKDAEVYSDAQSYTLALLLNYYTTGAVDEKIASVNGRIDGVNASISIIYDEIESIKQKLSSL